MKVIYEATVKIKIEEDISLDIVEEVKDSKEEMDNQIYKLISDEFDEGLHNELTIESSLKIVE